MCLGKGEATEGKNTGACERAGQRWRWTQTISKCDLPNTIEIDVSVARTSAKAGDGASEIAAATGFKSMNQPGTL